MVAFPNFQIKQLINPFIIPTEKFENLNKGGATRTI